MNDVTMLIGISPLGMLRTMVSVRSRNTPPSTQAKGTSLAWSGPHDETGYVGDDEIDPHDYSAG